MLEKGDIEISGLCIFNDDKIALNIDKGLQTKLMRQVVFKIKKQTVLLLFLSIFILQTLELYSQENDRSIENVKAFSEVYGYVRYFYPSDEAATIDWDDFARYGVSSVINIQSDDSLKVKLNELFLPIAPLIKIDYEIDTTQAYYKPKWPRRKKIAWQYIGYENDYKDSYYKCRTNRPHKKLSKNSKTASMTLNVNNFENDSIRVSAKLKLKKGSKGSGHLRLIQRMSDGGVYYNEMSLNPLIIQDSAVLCKIICAAYNKAKKIEFGFKLKGAGTMEVSNYKVEYLRNNIWASIDISNKEFIVNNEDTIIFNSNIPIVIQQNDTMILERRIAKYKQTPEYSDFTYSKISNSLFVYMPNALYGNKKHTFPISNPTKLNELKNKLSNIKAFDIENLNDRQANVIIMWNVFQHFYPYIDKFDAKWDNRLEYGLRKCYTESTKDAYIMLIRRLLSDFGDAHIYVSGPTDMVYYPPFNCKRIENKLVVLEVTDPNVPLKVGDVITKIDNKETDIILDSLKNYTSFITQENKYFRATQFLLSGKKESNINVQILRNKTVNYTFKIKRNIYINDYALSKANKTEPYYYPINDRVIYVDFTRIPRDTLKVLLPILQHYKNIIVDFRGYPQLRTMDWVPHIINEKDTIHNFFFTEEIIFPNQSKSQIRKYADRTIIPKEPFINGEIIYLINEKPVSAAETFLYYIKELEPNTIFIGQQTALTTGSITYFKLPGGYFVRFTGMLAIEKDNKLFEGIKPTIEVKPSIEGLMNGKDEVLEEAINHIQGK